VTRRVLHALRQLHHQLRHRHFVLLFDRAPRVETAAEGVLLGRRIAERARHVAHRRTSTVRDHVGDLGGTQAPVALVHVLDDLFATIAFDVEVDVGRPVALGRQETLEQQPQRHRVGFGDAERETHGTVGRAAAALAENVVAFAELHDVPHHEEVPGKPEMLDHFEFVVDGAPGPRTQRQVFVRAERTLAVATPPACFDQSTQVLDLAQAVGARKRRQARRDERQVERRGAGDVDCAIDHTRVPREPSALLCRAAQTRSGGRRQARVEFVEAAAVAHRGKRAREHVVAGRRVRHVVGGDGTDTALGGERDERVVAPHVERVAVVPHFDEHAVATEGVDQHLERAASRRRVVAQPARERPIVGAGEHEALPAQSLGERFEIEDGL